MNPEAIEREIDKKIALLRQRTRTRPLSRMGVILPPYPPGTDEDKIRQAPVFPAVWEAPNGAEVAIHAAELWQKHTPLWLRDGIFGGSLPSSDGHFEDTSASFMAKDVIQFRYSWAIPMPKALDALAALAPLVEIGAGGGYWASLLRQGGVDILAFDLKPYRNSQARAKWTQVLTGGPEQAANYPDRTLFLCWPPYDTPMADLALRLYRGNDLAYIGEPPGGCNADDDFFDRLASEWRETADLFIPQWWGLHDYLTTYRRKV